MVSLLASGACLLALAVHAPQASAKPPAAPPGSPSATRTIPGDQLPAPEPLFGDRAIYHEGWLASTKVMQPPWVHFPPKETVLEYPWELYDLSKDWTQATDVAAQNPEKLKEMQSHFTQEAEKCQVLPLDASLATRLITPRPSINAGRSVFTWTRPLTGTPNGGAPSVLNASYKFQVELEIPQGGAEGMLITQGGRFAGYGFYLLKGRSVFLWNLVDLERVKSEGPAALSPGRQVLEFDFDYDGLDMGTLAFGDPSGIGQGSDTLTGVNDADYQPPFGFTGNLDQVTLTIHRPTLRPADEKRLLEASRRAHAGRE